jgi:hypothetical protein
VRGAGDGLYKQKKSLLGAVEDWGGATGNGEKPSRYSERSHPLQLVVM